jgi:hypothetical protein
VRICIVALSVMIICILAGAYQHKEQLVGCILAYTMKDGVSSETSLTTYNKQRLFF